MKTIKFRAWDVLNSKWFDDIFAVGHSDEGNYVIDLDRWVYFEPTVIIEQFTGLLDKNGKEIYEGDIARCCYPNDLQPYIGAVDYYTESACYALSGYEALLQHFDEITVIGNIHENPELL